MLVIGIVLLVLGGVVAYYGRPREQLLFYAGVICFLIGLVFVIIWLAHTLDAETSHTVFVFGPVAWVLRKLADCLDGRQSVTVPSAFASWPYAPSPSSQQWRVESGATATSTPPGDYTVNLN